MAGEVIKKVKLTKKQYGQLIKFVEMHAKKRQDRGNLKDSCDYACGAMAVMAVLGIDMPCWFLSIMGNQPWFEGEIMKKGKRRG